MKTLAELQAIKDRVKGQVGIRSESDSATRIVVGLATCGIAAGARPVLKTLSDLVHESGIQDVTVTQTGCIGLCQYEPIVEVTQPGKEKITYMKMDADKAKRIFEEHIKGGTPVAEYQLNMK